jgi:hypothetical protein
MFSRLEGEPAEGRFPAELWSIFSMLQEQCFRPPRRGMTSGGMRATNRESLRALIGAAANRSMKEGVPVRPDNLLPLSPEAACFREVI